MPGSDVRPRTVALATLAAVVLAGLLSSWHSFGYYWNWDDLHLIRPYSPAELAGTLTGHWDPDGVETLGFRPLTTLFNHVRAVAFGENLPAHRLFLLALYGLALAIIGDLVRRLGAPRGAVFAGAAAAVLAKNSYYHYVWVADGVHVLQLLFGGVALWTTHAYVDSGRRAHLAVTVASFAAALLTREDSLAFVPLMLGVASAPAFISGGAILPSGARWTRLRAGAIAMAVLLPAWWLWRLMAVSNAPNFKLEGAAAGRIADMMLWTVSLVGGSDPLWPAFVALGLGAAAATFWLGPAERRLAWLLLAAALATCVIGNVRARVNLLIVPATCYGFFLGVVGVALWRRGRGPAAVVAILAVLSAGLAMRASRLEQRGLHPMSAGQVLRDWQFIAGPFRDATIPGVRREYLERKLGRLGLRREDADFDAWRQELLAQGRIGPQPDGGIFLPRRPFLEGAPVR